MKLGIYSLLIFIGNNVIGEEKQDEIPTLTFCKPPISQEELDSLNNLRTDIWKSLDDLKSKMTDDGSKSVDELKGKIINDLKAGNSTLSDLSDVGTIVEHLDVVVGYTMPEIVSGNIGNQLSAEADRNKWLEYNNTMVSEFEKRLEPLKKYED